MVLRRIVDQRVTSFWINYIWSLRIFFGFIYELLHIIFLA